MGDGEAPSGEEAAPTGGEPGGRPLGPGGPRRASGASDGAGRLRAAYEALPESQRLLAATAVVLVLLLVVLGVLSLWSMAGLWPGHGPGSSTVSQQERTVDQDNAAASQALTSVRQGSTFEGPLAGVSQALANEATDLGTTKQAAQQVAQEAGGGTGQGQVCGNAGQVSGDAGGVDGAAGGVEGAAQGVESAVQVTRQDVATLRTAFAQLTQARAVVPGYRPSGAVTRGAVQEAITTAQTAISRAVAQTNSDVDRANADIAAAAAAADSAATAGSCGPGPLPSTPEGHIA